MPPRPRNGTPPNALVSTALAKTVTSIGRTDADAALIQLARRYAEAIDDNLRIEHELYELGRLTDVDGLWELNARVKAAEKSVAKLNALNDLGPKLLAALVQLGATPAARKAVKGGEPVERDPVREAVDELRAARAARRDRA
jgi:hypothetical protein